MSEVTIYAQHVRNGVSLSNATMQDLTDTGYALARAADVVVLEHDGERRTLKAPAVTTPKEQWEPHQYGDGINAVRKPLKIPQENKAPPISMNIIQCPDCKDTKKQRHSSGVEVPCRTCKQAEYLAALDLIEQIKRADVEQGKLVIKGLKEELDKQAKGKPTNKQCPTCKTSLLLYDPKQYLYESSEDAYYKCPTCGYTMR